MRISWMATMAVLLLVPQASLAAPREKKPAPQSPEAAGSPPSAEIEAIKKRAAEYLTQCLSDWDKGTHMTRKDWNRTCYRVANEREKFMMSQVRKDGGEK
jgi:hypothetical protein